MLKQKLTTTGGALPPKGTGNGSKIGYVGASDAANEMHFKQEDSHQRRMRRQRRNERSRLRNSGGWSVGLW